MTGSPPRGQEAVGRPLLPACSSGVRRVTLDAGGLPLSGLLAEPAGPPRATVLALHGSGMNSGYFDGQAHPDLSLLTLGAALGHTVLALDRPGYGASAAHLPQGQSLREQAATLRRALTDHTSRHSLGEGVLVLAHSFGGKVALTAAAHGLHPDLLGLDISGCGHRYTDAARRPLSADRPRGHGLNWGPLGLYPPGTFTSCASVVCAAPAREAEEAARWEALFPAVAAKVCVPLRLTFAEHEGWWRHDARSVSRLKDRIAAPVVRVERQPAAGHNISLGRAARSYHLRALGFLEECLSTRAARSAGGSGTPQGRIRPEDG